MKLTKFEPQRVPETSLVAFRPPSAAETQLQPQAKTRERTGTQMRNKHTHKHTHTQTSLNQMLVGEQSVFQQYLYQERVLYFLFSLYASKGPWAFRVRTVRLLRR